MTSASAAPASFPDMGRFRTTTRMRISYSPSSPSSVASRPSICRACSASNARRSSAIWAAWESSAGVPWTKTAPPAPPVGDLTRRGDPLGDAFGEAALVDEFQGLRTGDRGLPVLRIGLRAGEVGRLRTGPRTAERGRLTPTLGDRFGDTDRALRGVRWPPREEGGGDRDRARATAGPLSRRTGDLMRRDATPDATCGVFRDDARALDTLPPRLLRDLGRAPPLRTESAVPGRPNAAAPGRFPGTPRLLLRRAGCRDPTTFEAPAMPSSSWAADSPGSGDNGARLPSAIVDRGFFPRRATDASDAPPLRPLLDVWRDARRRIVSTLLPRFSSFRCRLLMPEAALRWVPTDEPAELQPPFAER